MLSIPIDSADVREQAEKARARVEEAGDERRRHADECRDGWRGEDDQGRPIACTTCRPHLLNVACWECSLPRRACTTQREARRGPCCPGCDHAPHRKT